MLDGALNIVVDVLERGKRDKGGMYPDENSVYAMEDVTELCDKLGRIDDGIHWLYEASMGALSVWSNRHSTVQILEKLEEMYEKKYRMVAPVPMS
jgi:hypothetical protein